MKFKVNREAFGEALSRCAMVVPKKPIIDSIGYILFQKKGNVLTLRATNMAQEIISTVEVEGKDDAAVCLPGGLLNHVVSMIREDSLSIHFLKNRAEIRTSSGKYSMATIGVEDFVAPMLCEGTNTILVNHAILSRSMEVAGLFCNPKDMRPSIQGINMQCRGTNIIFEGTNTRSWGRAEAPFITGTSWAPVLIPKDFCRLTQAIVTNGDAKLTASQNLIRLDGPNYSITSVLITEKFPDCDTAFLSKKPSKEIEVSKGEIEESLRRIKPFLSDLYPNIVVDPLHGKDLVIKGEDNDYGNSAEEKIPILGSDVETLTVVGLEFDAIHKICATNNECAKITIAISDDVPIVYFDMEGKITKESYCLGKIHVIAAPEPEKVGEEA